jgi:hypothetical protein
MAIDFRLECGNLEPEGDLLEGGIMSEKKARISKPRRPKSGLASGDIPRGIDVLVKKASVDPGFRKRLIEKRGDAAKEIDLELDPSERLILDHVSEAQLEAVVSRARVNWKDRAVFLGRTATVMLAALGTVTMSTGCGTKGHRAERPAYKKSEVEAPSDERTSSDTEA